jgi:hypothetical protein
LKAHSGIALGDAHKAMARMYAFGAQTLHSSIKQDFVQLASMNADFGHGIPGMTTAQLTVDKLPMAIEKRTLQIFYARSFKGRLQAKHRQLAHGVRQQCDAHAQLTDFGHGLKNIAIDPSLVQVQGQR